MYHYSESQNKVEFVMLKSMLDAWDKTSLVMIYWFYIARLNLLPCYLCIVRLDNCDWAILLSGV